MGSMVTKRKLLNYSKRYLFLGATSVLCWQAPASAIDFQLIPRLTVEEIYSDNIRLAAKGLEQGAFVTEVTPGISLRSVDGGRLSANLDYRMQNLFNAGGEGTAKIFHKLRFDTGYDVMRNSLFVDAHGSYSQRNISNLRNGDNINNLSGRTNVWTAGTSVKWTPHFSTFADADVKIKFDYIGNDKAEQLANSMNLSESVLLSSGLDFKRVTWVAAFNNATNFRENEDDVHFQNTNATVRTWIDRRFNFFATVGYANNSFQNLDPGTNGFFYTVGGQWKPAWYFDVEAGYGNNWHVTSNLSLSQRTRLSAGYFDRSKGLNTGGAWNASFNHTTRNSSWRFSYIEDTTTVQELLNGDRDIVKGFDDDLMPTSTSQSVPVGHVNDVLVRKIANASISYTTGKSRFQLGGFYERREFENTNNDQEIVYGADASWSWQFIRRTSFFISPSWQHIQGDTPLLIDELNTSADLDRYQIITRLTRTLPINIGRSKALNTSIEYRFVQQDSKQVDNSYIENRVTASVSMKF